MLNNFKKVKNIGRFYDVSIGGTDTCAATFKKFNLIYADNGTGKSTITTILKSLWKNDPQKLIEKRTIGAIGESFVELNVDDETYKFENNQWNKNPKIDFEIFDEEFVEKNVFSPKGVDVENRRELFNYIVFDEKTVNKVNEIQALDSQLKGELKNAIDTAESTLKIKANISDIADLDNTTEMPDDALEALRAQVKQINIRIEDAKLITASPILDKIPDFDPILYTESISENLGTLSLAAEYKAHIKLHNAWLKDGVDIVQGEDSKSCPFCFQSLENTDAFKIYTTVFSEEYSALRKRVEQYLASVKNIYSDAAIKNAISVIEQNNERFVFWQKHNKEIPESLSPNISLEQSIMAFKIALENLLQRKKGNLLEATLPNQTEELGLGEEARFRQAIIDYNKAIDNNNNLIHAIKNSIQNVVALTPKNEQDRKIVACNDVRYRNQETANLYKNLEQHRLQKKNAENRIKELRVEIDQESLIILEQYQDSINKELENFGVNFSIKGVKRRSDVSRKESVYFNICLRGKSFDPNGSAGSPYRLSNTLSSGDKSTLAFAFFIAKYREKDLSNQILVFDDPITSLDFFRKTQTQKIIEQFTKVAAQVIVLTHSINFAESFKSIKVIKDECKDSKHFVWIRKNHSTSGLSYIPHNKFSEMGIDTHSRNYKHITEYITEPASVERIDVMRSIRPYVETTLKKDRPDWASLSLGKIIGHLRTEGTMCEDDIRNLSIVNDAIVNENHGSVDANANHLENTTDDELMHICKLALDISAPPPR